MIFNYIKRFKITCCDSKERLAAKYKNNCTKTRC